MFDYKQLPKTQQYYDNYDKIDWSDGKKADKEAEREEASPARRTDSEACGADSRD